MMTYHHWDEPDYDWHWYYVAAYHPEYGVVVEQPWPVLAPDADAAMDVYLILLRHAVGKL
jgi:hypothetical protein